MKPLLSLFHSTWIEIRNGRANLLKGSFPGRTLSDLSDIFAHHPDLKGSIRSSRPGRYGFSGSIPEPLRQRARNVLASF